MALRWKNFVPNTPLKAAEVNDLANNGCVQIDTATDLDDPNLVDANLAFDLATSTLYQRAAAGVGADKWQPAGGGGLSGLGGWADITAVTGSPVKHAYKDAAGTDWVAYEWATNGNYSITTAEGMLDILACGAGVLSNNNGHGDAGEFARGAKKVGAGAHAIRVGARGTSASISTMFSTLADAGVGAGGHGEGNGWGAAGRQGLDTRTTGWPTNGSANGNPAGISDDITGVAVEYCKGAHPGDIHTTPGSGGQLGVQFAQGNDGCVIVRVPRANAKA